MSTPNDDDTAATPPQPAQAPTPTPTPPAPVPAATPAAQDDVPDNGATEPGYVAGVPEHVSVDPSTGNSDT